MLRHYQSDSGVRKSRRFLKKQKTGSPLEFIPRMRDGNDISSRVYSIPNDFKTLNFATMPKNNLLFMKI